MADNYRKNCRECNAPIRMAQMANGQWLPFDVSGGKHTCASVMTAVTSAVSASPFTAVRPKASEPDYERADASSAAAKPHPTPGILPHWLWLALIILFLLWMILNWVASWWPW